MTERVRRTVVRSGSIYALTDEAGSAEKEWVNEWVSECVAENETKWVSDYGVKCEIAPKRICVSWIFYKNAELDGNQININI